MKLYEHQTGFDAIDLTDQSQTFVKVFIHDVRDIRSKFEVTIVRLGRSNLVIPLHGTRHMMCVLPSLLLAHQIEADSRAIGDMLAKVFLA